MLICLTQKFEVEKPLLLNKRLDNLKNYFLKANSCIRQQKREELSLEN